MKKILTIFLCASLLCTGCGSSSKASKSEIMGGDGGAVVGAGISTPGGKDTKKTTKAKSTKKTSKTKETKSTKSTTDSRDTKKSTTTRTSRGYSVSDIMEQRQPTWLRSMV